MTWAVCSVSLVWALYLALLPLSLWESLVVALQLVCSLTLVLRLWPLQELRIFPARTSLVLSCLLFLHAASFRWDQSSWLLAILVTLLVLSLCFLCRTQSLFGCVSSTFLHGDRAMIHCHHSLTIHVMAQPLYIQLQHQSLQLHQQQPLLLQ